MYFNPIKMVEISSLDNLPRLFFPRVCTLILIAVLCFFRWMYHHLFNQTSIDGHLSYFQVFLL